MNIRTDLILEQQQSCQKELHGLQKTEENIGNTTLYTVKIRDETAAKELQKPVGTYCTVSFPRLDFVCDTTDIVNATVKALKTVFKNDTKN